jgi:hypothetical protein
VPFGDHNGHAEENETFEEAETEALDDSTRQTSTREVKQVRIDETATKCQTISEYADLAESDSDDEAEFFDAIDNEDLEVGAVLSSEKLIESEMIDSEAADLWSAKLAAIEPAYKGYEDPVRMRLKMDKDDRPKISLWVSQTVQ